MNARRGWLTAAGAVVTTVCLAVLYRSITPEAIEAIRNASLPWLAICLLIGATAMAVRAERWRSLLLRGGAHVSFFQAFWTSAAGQMINTFLPARMGDAFRGLAAAPVASRAFSMGTVIVERVLDTGVVVLAAAGALAVAPEVSWWIKPSVIMLSIGMLGALAVLGALPFIGKALVAYAGSKFPAHRRLGEELLEGMLLVWKPGIVARFLLLSVAAWSIDALGLTAVVQACSASINWSAGLLLVAVLAFASAIPATGMVGVVPLACAFVLPSFGVSKGQALAVGILLQTLTLLLYGVTGGIGIWVLRHRAGARGLAWAVATPEKNHASS